MEGHILEFFLEFFCRRTRRYSTLLNTFNELGRGGAC
jgi:hypothetical protein